MKTPSAVFAEQLMLYLRNYSRNMTALAAHCPGVFTRTSQFSVSLSSHQNWAGDHFKVEKATDGSVWQTTGRLSACCRGVLF